jgi:hypothetical protein
VTVVATLTLGPGDSDATVRSRLGRRGKSPVIAVFGTTASIDDDLVKRLSTVIEAIVGAASDAGAVIVTGGTDAGIIRLVGRAGHKRATLIGVAPEAVINDPSIAVELEPHHDQVVLAPGSTWGDETPELEKVVDALSAGSPVCAVLLGGGDVSRNEVDGQLRARRPVVVVAGSGRLADDLATNPPDAGDVILVDVADGRLALQGLLSALLTKGKRKRRRLRDRVAALSALPSWRRPRPAYQPFLGFAARSRFPELAPDITEAEAAVRDAFIESDTAALEEQRRYRFVRLSIVIVGALTTTFAAVQVAIPNTAWPAVVVTTLAAGGTALTAAARRDGAFEGYLRQRTAAERLKSAFFVRLAQEPAADAAIEGRLRQQFAQDVVRMRHGGLKQ